VRHFGGVFTFLVIEGEITMISVVELIILARAARFFQGF